MGVRPGPVFGRWTDRALYGDILAGEWSGILDLVARLEEALVRPDIDGVVADAVEGYNAVHDLCRLAVNAAAERVRLREGKTLANHDFAVVGRMQPRDGDHELRLDEEAIERKRAAALNYLPLRSEVTAEIADTESFRREVLRPILATDGEYRPPSDPPQYEAFGRVRVAAGRYRQVLEYRRHMAPLARRLSEFARRDRAVA
jgi:hypothetical protein